VTTTIKKACADLLRSTYSNLPGGKLRSSHAHEIVAAYFGYNTAAALRAEDKYPLTALSEAEILIPDLQTLDKRVPQLNALPAGFPGVNELADTLTRFIREQDYFSGDVWMTRELDEYMNVSFIQDDPAMIEDDLSGQISTTNAYFDELYVEEVDLSFDIDTLVANISGSLNGENDPDQMYYGDSIHFKTVMTFQRVAARVAFLRPGLETSGAIDLSGFDGDVAA
jgi:hypothetical protein